MIPMHTLTVKLKQHTPLLHFQPQQYGATLRASEVKPKLDRFLIDKLGGIVNIKKDWLVGNGEHPALDYKMRIEGIGDCSIKLKSHKKNGKWITDNFPSIMSNMGGKETEEELINFSMYKELNLTITCFKDNDLCELLKDNLPLFFARHNFGQRSSKGFGSFAVSHMGKDEVKMGPYFKSILSMDYNMNEEDKPYDIQWTVMGIIESFWKTLKSKIKNDPNIVENKGQRITTIQQYIKRMGKGQMSNFKTDSDSRMPSSVFFKPVKYKGKYRIYILPDSAMLKRIDNDSESKRTIQIADKKDMSYIDEEIIGGYDDKPGSLGIDYETNKWETTIGRGREEKKVCVQF